MTADRYDAKAFSHVDELMQSGILHQVFPAACILAGRGERILYRKAWGHLNPGTDSAPCNAQTRFDLASLTKPLVVATLCMKAVEEGKLCLQDGLLRFGTVPEDKANIRIKQILTHTAGFGSGLRLWQNAGTGDGLICSILASQLRFPAGEQCLYSDYGYILLAKVLEKVYGMGLQELAHEKLFAPLKMAHTDFLPSGDNIASTEQQPDGSYLTGIVHDENARLLGGVAGNAGLFSTMDDLARYAQMMLAKGRLPDGRHFLSEASVRRMSENQIPGCTSARSMGFWLPYAEDGFTGDLFPKESFAHTGFTGTSLTMDPVGGIFLILLTNRVCPSREGTEIHRFRRLIHNAVYAACSDID